MTINERIENYKATSAADAYILGITYHETVYELVVDEIPDFCFKGDRESKSHGGVEKIRFRLTIEEKWLIIHRYGARAIGTPGEILAGRKNKGEAWEKYQTEKAGQEWHKDSVPYYKDGDLTVNGVKYQIKFEDASFANENTIRDGMAYKAAR